MAAVKAIDGVDVGVWTPPMGYNCRCVALPLETQVARVTIHQDVPTASLWFWIEGHSARRLVARARISLAVEPGTHPETAMTFRLYEKK